MSSDKEEKTETTEKKEAPPAEKPKAAPPAKEEPKLPEFEKGIVDKITKKFADKTEVVAVKENRIAIKTKKMMLKK